MTSLIARLFSRDEQSARARGPWLNNRTEYPKPMGTLTDAIYWAAQPPEINALHAIRDLGQRQAEARRLAMAGFVIDVPIMVDELTTPAVLMTIRKNIGLTWVPNALQDPIFPVPGAISGPFTYDGLHPPPGAIKVSDDAADPVYAPFAPVVAPPPPVDTAAIGGFLGFTMPLAAIGPGDYKVYSSNAKAHLNEGDRRAGADGLHYYYHMLGASLMDPMHRTGVWLQIPAVA